MTNPIFTLSDARAERYAAEARAEAKQQAREAADRATFARTRVGRLIAEARALRFIPPQYAGGAAEWRSNNAEA